MAKAAEFLNKAIEILKKLFGDYHKYLALAYFRLANVEKETGKLKESKKCLEESKDIWLKFFGETNLNVATSYIFLGLLNSNNGNFLEAKECHKKCLKIFLKLFGGKNTPNLGRCYRNVGYSQFAMGNWLKAQKYYLKSLEIYENCEKEDFKVADCYYYLSKIHEKLDNYDEALKKAQKAYTIVLIVYGPEHETTQMYLSHKDKMKNIH